MGVTFAAVGPMVAFANAQPGVDGARAIFGAIIGAGVISMAIAPLVSKLRGWPSPKPKLPWRGLRVVGYAPALRTGCEPAAASIHFPRVLLVANGS